MRTALLTLSFILLTTTAALAFSPIHWDVTVAPVNGEAPPGGTIDYMGTITNSPTSVFSIGWAEFDWWLNPNASAQIQSTNGSSGNFGTLAPGASWTGHFASVTWKPTATPGWTENLTFRVTVDGLDQSGAPLSGLRQQKDAPATATVTPELSSSALLLLGLAPVILARRRKLR